MADPLRIKQVILHHSSLIWTPHSSFFAVNTKLPGMAILASKDFTAATKIPSVGLNLMITGARDYYWFKSLMHNQLN